MESVLRAFCVLACLAAAAAPAWGASPAKLQVVANDLNNPRKISVGKDGAVYVVEAGSGSNVGTQRCLRTCVGHTGAVVKVDGGKITPVVTGLTAIPTASSRIGVGTPSLTPPATTCSG